MGGTYPPDVPDGVVAVVKRDCATCNLVEPVLARLVGEGVVAAVYSQDDPAFPTSVHGVADDRELAVSYFFDVETVPTLLRVVAGAVVDRTAGWSSDAWTAFTGFDLSRMFPSLPTARPGCGSMTLDLGMPEALATRYGRANLRARRVTLAAEEDEWEAMHARGWSDGLPVVAPTEARVLRMLGGTRRRPDELVAVVPPDLVECSVEKVAINAVLAGCLPEYLPVVLAAVAAACTPTFNIHGLLATTYFSGPVVVVSGPIAEAIGMNSGVNVFGQGNRANSTIGRALQLVVRNVGGGVPGGVDRAAFGQPGKVGFCFPEAEGDARAAGWATFGEERGVAPDVSAVTLFGGDAPRGVTDQRSREAPDLTGTFAAALAAAGHPELEALLAVSPEHLRTFAAAGWDRARLRAELAARVPGAGAARDLLVVCCGGRAGMFSAVMAGWTQSSSITEEITPWT